VARKETDKVASQYLILLSMSAHAADCISRRNFLKMCGGLAVSLLLPSSISGAFAAPKVRCFSSGDPTQPYISLTFDDGWDESRVRAALDQLAQLNLPASFFPVGKAIQDSPTVWQEALEAGIELYNHTYAHSNLSLLSQAEIQRSVLGWERAYEQLGWGAYQNKVLRCPKNRGTDSPDLYTTLYRLGYQGVAGWSIDSGGYQSGATARSVLGRVQPRLAPGAIILCHFTKADIEALPGMAAAATDEGLTFVSLSHLPGTPIYQPPAAPTPASPKCRPARAASPSRR
jgi:peptidoglycan-N-acetylmuramic acid deacetylase